MVLSGNTPAVFCDVNCCFTSCRFFIHCVLTSSLTLQRPIARFTLPSIYPFFIFNPAYWRIICDTFILPFQDLHFTVSDTVLSKHFFTNRRFLPCTPFCHPDEIENIPSRFLLYICCHRVAPFVCCIVQQRLMFQSQDQCFINYVSEPQSIQ